jgi:hypothetical protein
MLVKKTWKTVKIGWIKNEYKYWEGWFLFGLIPIYVRQI